MDQGDILIKRQTVKGKIVECKILSSYPDGEYMIHVQLKVDKKFDGDKKFIHKSLLNKHWHEAKNGIQLKLLK